MERQILSILVSNHFGVLTRVTNLFSRRGFNIKELTVGETKDPMLSRITILTEGDERTVDQIKKQLAKLEDVKVVAVLPQEGVVSRELLLIKIKYERNTFDKLKSKIESFGGKILSAMEDTAIVEYTGDTESIDCFIAGIEDILELCRTGITALQTGKTTLCEFN